MNKEVIARVSNIETIIASDQLVSLRIVRLGHLRRNTGTKLPM